MPSTVFLNFKLEELDSLSREMIKFEINMSDGKNCEDCNPEFYRQAREVKGSIAWISRDIVRGFRPDDGIVLPGHGTLKLHGPFLK